MNIPNHVAIIMDGNGRWAKERNLPRSMGHKEGSNNLKRLANYIFSKGIRVLSVFAFSTENFQRDKDEVNYLMELFYNGLKNITSELRKKDVRIVFSKKESGLPEKLEKLIRSLEETTINNKNGIFNICLNYGGQSEILDMTKKVALEVKENKISIDDITEEVIMKNLYCDLPPVDLLIRTSGEYRLSNYMLLQIAYAELYFTDVYFPDFDEKEFDKAIVEYNNRNRRFGKNQK